VQAGGAIPAGNGLALGIEARHGRAVVQGGILLADIVVVGKQRRRHLRKAVGADMPLQVANPQHYIGNGGGAWVQLQP
jgi:hypothetical protein